MDKEIDFTEAKREFYLVAGACAMEMKENGILAPEFKDRLVEVSIQYFEVAKARQELLR